MQTGTSLGQQEEAALAAASAGEMPLDGNFDGGFDGGGDAGGIWSLGSRAVGWCCPLQLAARTRQQDIEHAQACSWLSCCQVCAASWLPAWPEYACISRSRVPFCCRRRLWWAGRLRAAT